MKSPIPSNQYKWLPLFGLVILLLHAIGWVWPEVAWGTHFPAFLNGPWNWLLPLTAGLVVLSGFLLPPFRIPRLKGKGFSLGVPLLSGMLMGLVFYHFPIETDLYGDVQRFAAEFEKEPFRDSLSHWREIINPNLFYPKNGERTVLNLIQLIAHDFQLSPAAAFRWLNAICGGLFVWVWLSFVNLTLERSLGRFAGGILGISGPFLWIFFGQQEVYAPVIPLVTACLGSMVLLLRSGKSGWLWVMVVTFILSLKFHSSSLLLAPAVVLSLLRHQKPDEKWVQQVFTPKGLLIRLVLPLFALGALTYFFILGDHADPRYLDGKVSDFERLFLPLLAPEAPLDRYTLLHPNHLWDYLNMVLLWSGGAWAVVLISGTLLRKSMSWQKPELLLTGLTLGLYASFFFLINPLLSMPMDWDLFSIPAPVLLVFAVVLIRHWADEIALQKLLPILIGTGLLSLAAWSVNASKTASSHRLERTGVWVYQSYWIRSGEDIRGGIALLGENSPQYPARLQSVAAELEPLALMGKDREYAELLRALGKYYRERNEFESALRWHAEAAKYDPDYPANALGLYESYLFLGKYSEAYETARHLIRLKYPDEGEAQVLALRAALEANLPEAAMGHCEAYLKIDLAQPAVTGIRQALQDSLPLDSARAFFEPLP